MQGKVQRLFGAARSIFPHRKNEIFFVMMDLPQGVESDTGCVSGRNRSGLGKVQSGRWRETFPLIDNNRPIAGDGSASGPGARLVFSLLNRR